MSFEGNVLAAVAAYAEQEQEQGEGQRAQQQLHSIGAHAGMHRRQMNRMNRVSKELGAVLADMFKTSQGAGLSPSMEMEIKRLLRKL